jgi:proteasome lid subunit RPN8/RPN11
MSNRRGASCPSLVTHQGLRPGKTPTIMFHALVKAARRLAAEFPRYRRRVQTAAPPQIAESPAQRRLQPLERLLLTDGVSRTLFEEYAEHQSSNRGEEETGWILLGYREVNEAVALATLPAGTQRQAGVAHVLFNSNAQVVGSRIVRQKDRRLSMLGVVHTHPGSLRHPSDGDFRGDSRWVEKLRGKEGVFGIGTRSEAAHVKNGAVGAHPKPHVQTLGQSTFCWYSLKQGDARYRPLPVELTLGPDLARPLHSVWPAIEVHAERIERLARQQAGVSFELVDGQQGPVLSMTVPLAEPGDAIRLLLEGKEVAYLLQRGGEHLMADAREDRIDQGVYLLLAELAAQS